MSIEAMKQALEALERSVATCFDQHAHQQAMSRPDHFINQAITSLRQAIEEAEKQEPVAVVQDLDEVKRKHLVYECGFDWKDPLYTHPQPKQQPSGDKYTSFGLMGGDKFVNEDSLKRSIT